SSVSRFEQLEWGEETLIHHVHDVRVVRIHVAPGHPRVWQRRKGCPAAPEIVAPEESVARGGVQDARRRAGRAGGEVERLHAPRVAFASPRVLRRQRSPRLFVMKVPPRPETPSTSPGPRKRKVLNRAPASGPTSLAFAPADCAQRARLNAMNDEDHCFDVMSPP